MRISPGARGVTSPVESASFVGLHYTNDGRPGIRRVRRRSGFTYLRADGRPVRSKSDLRRIRSLVIPPAWRDVWICPDAAGHLQATGRDARGRKQYRYHRRWRETRDENKYHRLIGFAERLPAIRRRTRADLERRGLPREKVLAAVVQLLEKTLIRVGNDEYARHNHSFGLTTLHDAHVRLSGSRLRFVFRGKSGVEHDVDLWDRRLARIVRACRDIPGHELFQYYGDAGDRRPVGSGDVNGYLKDITACDYTSKDFRTWAGTVLAAELLSGCERAVTATQAKRNIVRVVKAVAGRLGNTEAVCRKSYIHPAILERYLGDSLRHVGGRARSKAWLSATEQGVLDLLRRAAAVSHRRAS
jgi:DNA topoisomerase-1